MKAIRHIMLAATMSVGLVTAAQAHPFIGVGVLGGPVFPVASSAQSAPPLPVFAHSNAFGPAPLPSEAQPVTYAQPAIGNIDSIVNRADPANGIGRV